MAVTLAQFAERLVAAGLISADDLAAFRAALPPEKRPQDAQSLARELILAERLTKFQAEAVYRGNLKGLVMGEYVVLDRIGAGGMGEVLKARHRTMERVVALKVLPAKAVDSPDAVKRFYREWTGKTSPGSSRSTGRWRSRRRSTASSRPPAGSSTLTTRA